MRIAMVGSGYVGLVSGTCLADVGHTVICVDKDQGKIAKLRTGKSPIYEPGLDALIARNVEHDRLSFSTDLGAALKGADVAFIAVGTPEGEDGSADLTYVLDVARSIGSLVQEDLLVVVKSTVPVGTCDRVDATIQEALAARKSSVKVRVASNPEFLKEGVAIGDFMRPDRIVVGVAEEESGADFERIYELFVRDDPGKLHVMDRRSSELTKYASNAMLATRISFMNELAQLAAKIGADIDRVRQGMGSDPRIGRKFLFAGPGFGGSCFPKDVQALRYLAEQQGVALKVVDATWRANADHKKWLAERVEARLKPVDGKTVAVWGLAFKPQTDDVRETPAVDVIRRLLTGGARVVAHDPQAVETFQRLFGPNDRLSYAKSAYEALKGASGLVLVTEWSEYKQPNWEKIAGLMRHKNVFDLRNQWRLEDLAESGFHYEAVGRPDSTYRRQGL